MGFFCFFCFREIIILEKQSEIYWKADWRQGVGKEKEGQEMGVSMNLQEEVSAGAAPGRRALC